MKQVQINKQKVKIFEEKELREKFNLNENEINLVLDYQRKFPELLTDEGEGFCVDARNLHSKLVKEVKGKDDGTKRNGSKFNDWIKRRIKKYGFEENLDYIAITQKKVTAQGNISEYVEYKITLDTAKQLCMIENNEVGIIVRKYFILMEKTLRNNEQWNTSRKDEKVNWNVMSDAIKEWCIRNDYDSEDRTFYTREANMINEALLGYKAADINSMLKNADRLTRNHLDTRINKAINDIQQFNINLLSANMSFDNRKQIIVDTCEGRYSDLKDYFLEIVHK